MSIDYSEVMIGAPAEVFDAIGRRLGAFNLHCINLRTGLTSDPTATFARHQAQQPWLVMNLLWVTHSFALAIQMQALLRAWDGKLFAAEELVPESGSGRRAASFYAYALTR
ncbi:MAG: hypothetical protein V1797_15120 [Pseudomonadota bacterium]